MLKKLDWILLGFLTSLLFLLIFYTYLGQPHSILPRQRFYFYHQFLSFFHTQDSILLPSLLPAGQQVRFYRDTGLSLDEVTTTGYTIQWQNEGQAAPHRATLAAHYTRSVPAYCGETGGPFAYWFSSSRYQPLSDAFQVPLEDGTLSACGYRAGTAPGAADAVQYFEANLLRGEVLYTVQLYFPQPQPLSPSPDPAVRFQQPLRLAKGYLAPLLIRYNKFRKLKRG